MNVAAAPTRTGAVLERYGSGASFRVLKLMLDPSSSSTPTAAFLACAARKASLPGAPAAVGVSRGALSAARPISPKKFVS